MSLAKNVMFVVLDVVIVFYLYILVIVMYNLKCLFVHFPVYLFFTSISPCLGS